MESYPFVQKQSCSGCGACVQACARRALEMQADEEGFLYPARSAGKCVRCGLCHAICPAAGGTHQENGTFDGDAYLCTSVDRSFARKSATAGICTRLSLDCVGRSGKVFGVVLDETDWKARHVCAGDEETVERMRNSKYLQSDTRDTYSEAKSLLKAGEEVLYVGTPCQIAGLKAFLGRPHERLLTVDLVCHGVFSPKLVPLEVSYWENLFKGKVSDLRFRSKRAFPWYMGGVVNFDVTDSRGKTRHVERHAKSSPTYRCFAYSGDGVSYNLRPSCYSCPFRGKGRYGDLTVGDAWGLYERYRKFYPPPRGEGRHQRPFVQHPQGDKRGHEAEASLQICWDSRGCVLCPARALAGGQGRSRQEEGHL